MRIVRYFSEDEVWVIGYFAFGERNQTLPNTSFTKVENIDNKVRQRWDLNQAPEDMPQAVFLQST